MTKEESGLATLTAFVDDPEAAKTAAMSQCDVCRSPGSAAQPLLRCAKCKVLWYCSKDCQVAAWPAHKKMCKKLKEELESSQEDGKLDAVMARLREDMKALVAKKGGAVPQERAAPADKGASLKVVLLDGAPVSDSALPNIDGSHCATFENGDRYEGSFSKGQMNGGGKYTWADGQTYVGQYADGRQHGLGKYRNEGGDEFEGSWVHGKRHGRGVSVFASGSRFEGEFEDDKQHGRGTYTWADGDKYEGEWDGSDMHGTGIFSFASGKVFEGTLFRDRPVQGVLTDVDGLRYRVTYKKGAAEVDGAIYDDPPTLTKTLIDA